MKKSLRKRFDRTNIFVLKSWYKFTSLEACHSPMKLFQDVVDERSHTYSVLFGLEVRAFKKKLMAIGQGVKP